MSLRNVRILLLVLMALEAALLIFGPQSGDHLPEIEAALAAKAKPPWWDDAAMGVRYAAWINLGLLAVLLGTSQWWTRTMPGPEYVRSLENKGRTPKWFWPLVILAIFTCVGLRLPLASKSLWWDEAWVAMQVSHGKWNPDAKKPGELKFQAHDWKRCAFYYPKPTNHVPMSLAQKASLDAWRKFTGAKRHEFSDLAARVPALIASCVAVALVATLLQVWGWPAAGIVAAFLLALHPWHIRYGVDARAYALVVPLCLFGIAAVSGIIRSRGASLVAWCMWGLVEFLWLWAYPNAVIDIAVFNLLVVIVLWRDKEARVTGVIRLVVTNLFAAMALIQVFLPNVMQATRWAGEGTFHLLHPQRRSENVTQPLDLHLIKSTLSHLFLGVEYVWARTVETGGLISSAIGLPGTSFAGAMLTAAISASVLIFMSWGRKDSALPRRWLMFAVPVFSGLFFTALVGVTGSYFYQRFIIAMLPCVIAVLVMLFAEALADKTPSPQHRRWSRHAYRSVAVLLLIFLILKIAPFWFAQDRLLMSRPYAPLRDVTEYARLIGNQNVPPGKQAMLVCYGHGYEVLPLYLTGVRPALSSAELEQFINQARAEQRSLLVMQGHTVHNRGSIPDGFTLLDDRNVFEEIKAFPAIEPEFYFRVFRLK